MPTPTLTCATRWLPLEARQVGAGTLGTVLILGVTGMSGFLAAQNARLLGAARVVGAGRSELGSAGHSHGIARITARLLLCLRLHRSCHCRHETFSSHLMRFVDFGDVWREGGCQDRRRWHSSRGIGRGR